MTQQTCYEYLPYSTYAFPDDIHRMPDATYVTIDDLRPLIQSLTELPHFRYDPHMQHNAALETLKQLVKEK